MLINKKNATYSVHTINNLLLILTIWNALKNYKKYKFYINESQYQKDTDENN